MKLVLGTGYCTTEIYFLILIVATLKNVVFLHKALMLHYSYLNLKTIAIVLLLEVLKHWRVIKTGLEE